MPQWEEEGLSSKQINLDMQAVLEVSFTFLCMLSDEEHK